MKISKNDSETVISYSSREQLMSYVFLYLVLLGLTGLPLYLLGLVVKFPPLAGQGFILFYLALLGGFLFFGMKERKIVLGEDGINIHDGPPGWLRTAPIEPGETVLFFDVYPDIKWGLFPEEVWEITLAYRDGRSILVACDIGNYGDMREIYRAIAEKYGIYTVDYSFVFQSERVFYLPPRFLFLNYGDRVTYFPELIFTAEEPESRSVTDVDNRSSKHEFIWVDITLFSFIQATFTAFLASLLVFLGFVGSVDSLVRIPLPGNGFIYTLIFAVYLIYVMYLTGIRNTLILDREHVEFVRYYGKFPLQAISIPLNRIEELRIRPTPKGFEGTISGDGKTVRLRTRIGGMEDFANVLWLMYQVQEFLLQNRIS